MVKIGSFLFAFKNEPLSPSYPIWSMKLRWLKVQRLPYWQSERLSLKRKTSEILLIRRVKLQLV